jgi:hypothetical protein
VLLCLALCVCVCDLQLTDVDPPYGKAPAAQLAEKLPESGRTGEVFDTTREMLLETQVRGGRPCACVLMVNAAVRLVKA